MSDVEPWLEQLRALPFVKNASWTPTVGDSGSDGRLRLRTPTGFFALRTDVKTSHLGPAVVRELAARARASGEPWILFAPFVSRPSAKLLAEHGVLFVDRGGNHRVVLGARYQSIVLGNPIATRATPGAGRLASQRVLFALLVKPELAGATLRVVAKESGASKNAVADAQRRLEEEGLLVRTRKGAQLVGARALRSRWVAAYAALLRPPLLLGRFEHRMQAPAAREAAIERALRTLPGWAFGGASAAYRLAPHHRGERTTLVLAERADAAELTRTAGLKSARDGSVLIFAAPGPLALTGPVRHVVHPLLAYAELLAGDDERATEAAAELLEKRLGGGA